MARVDLKMPGVDGGTVCARLRILRPDMRLGVMSGFVDEEQQDQLSGLGVPRILPKPFTKALLSRTLMEALARRGLGSLPR